jgi:ATP-binding protein involved in chromosome partitioning
MGKLTEASVIEALKQVKDPELGRDVVSLNMIKDLTLGEDDSVSLTLELTTPACPIKGEFQENVRQALLRAGAKTATVNLSASMRHHAFSILNQQEMLPGVKNTVAIASGKGGVGKSTVTVNVALSLAQDGAVVGILDADIYGPTIPLMMNVHELPPPAQGKIIPPLRHNCKVMSMGLILPKGEAVVWRGPMVSKMVREFLSVVEWGELDYLLIDLPPGTGDIALTLAQSIPLSGIVVVTTPQEAATSIATKAISMFGKLKVPILGLIENMSHYICPSCGHSEEIFGSGGGEKACQENGIPFLGKIPLHSAIRESGDAGTPIVASNPDSLAGKAFKESARKMAGRISVLRAGLNLLTPMSTST